MKRLFFVMFTLILVIILLSSCASGERMPKEPKPEGLSKEQRKTNAQRERGGACKQNAGMVGY